VVVVADPLPPAPPVRLSERPSASLSDRPAAKRHSTKYRSAAQVERAHASPEMECNIGRRTDRRTNGDESYITEMSALRRRAERELERAVNRMIWMRPGDEMTSEETPPMGRNFLLYIYKCKKLTSLKLSVRTTWRYISPLKQSTKIYVLFMFTCFFISVSYYQLESACKDAACIAPCS